MSDIPVIMLAAMALAYAGIGLHYFRCRTRGLCKRESVGAGVCIIIALFCMIAWPLLCLAGANGKDKGE